MSLELPLFRVVMGVDNAYFDDARSENVVLKHTPPDFYERYLRGEENDLKTEIVKNFRARYPNEGDPPKQWVTRYYNDAVRFHEAGHARFVTYKRREVWWAETEQGCFVWKRAYEGSDEDPVPTDVVGRLLDRPWSRRTLAGTPLDKVIHSKAFDSLGHNRSELGRANEELEQYFNALIEERDVTPWTRKPEWVSAEIRERRKNPSSGAGRNIVDILYDALQVAGYTTHAVHTGEVAGHVYAARAPQVPEWIKIGYTTKPNPEDRLKDLQEGNPFQLELVYAKSSAVAFVAETEAHLAAGEENRGLGEWFRITPARATKAVDQGVGAVEAGVRKLTKA